MQKAYGGMSLRMASLQSLSFPCKNRGWQILVCKLASVQTNDFVTSFLLHVGQRSAAQVKHQVPSILTMLFMPNIGQATSCVLYKIPHFTEWIWWNTARLKGRFCHKTFYTHLPNVHLSSPKQYEYDGTGLNKRDLRRGWTGKRTRTAHLVEKVTGGSSLAPYCVVLFKGSQLLSCPCWDVCYSRMLVCMCSRLCACNFSALTHWNQRQGPTKLLIKCSQALTTLGTLLWPQASAFCFTLSSSSRKRLTSWIPCRQKDLGTCQETGLENFMDWTECIATW